MIKFSKFTSTHPENIRFALYNSLAFDNRKDEVVCCWKKLCICARNCQVYLMEKLSFIHQNGFHFHISEIPFSLSTQLTGWAVTYSYCNIIYQTWYSHKTWLDSTRRDSALSTRKPRHRHTLFLYHYLKVKGMEFSKNCFQKTLV